MADTNSEIEVSNVESDKPSEEISTKSPLKGKETQLSEEKTDEKKVEVEEKVTNGNGDQLKEENEKVVEENGKIEEENEKMEEVNGKVEEENEKAKEENEKTKEEKKSDETKEESNEVKVDEDSLDDKLVQSKELYNNGRKNFLLKNYQLAAEELGDACGMFEEIYGAEAAELGMPLLLYAKSLIALSLDENKVLDVPDVEEEEDGDSDGQEDDQDVENAEAKPALDSIEEEKNDSSKTNGTTNGTVAAEENVVSSSSSSKNIENTEGEPSTSDNKQKPETNGKSEDKENIGDEEEEETEATNLQIAWETLELAAKIFTKQGMGGLPHLAEIHTELGNIQFENEIFDAAREDYGKALKIYLELPIEKHRRARAEIQYKIGLTYLLQTMNQEGKESFQNACDLLSEEIESIKNKKEDLSESDKHTIDDIHETMQDIAAKIVEIEETQQQELDEVRAALDKFKSPSKQPPPLQEKKENSTAAVGAVATSSKPTDITHLIKRKKPDTTSPEVESSPAKRVNVEKTG